MESNDFSREVVGAYLRTDTIPLSDDAVIEKVISVIRTINIFDQITYFYVTDDEGKLVGVLPIRRILSARPEQHVREVMLHKVLVLSENDSIATARELFNKHKYLAFPVVDSDRKLLGVFDITILTGKSLNLGENHRFDDIFETIGINASTLNYLTPFSAFRHRFPWLVPSLICGLASAFIASFFEQTIAESIILAFFLTLILGLGESVSIQTLSITIRMLHSEKLTWKWYLKSIKRELLTSMLLGVGVAIVLIIFIFLWKGTLLPGISIGLSVLLSLCTASFFGLSIPSLLHRTRLDPKVAAGPLALGLSDILTLFFYFSLAKALLKG
jgi:magnesium transporter